MTEIRRIETTEAPAAIGPYSQAILAGRTLYVSGQIPLDPSTGRPIDGDVQDQTRRVLDNLSAILRAAGTDLGHVVKTTIFLTDLGDFQAVNAVYAERFSNKPPARATVQVSALPLGAAVEIEAIALVPDGSG